MAERIIVGVEYLGTVQKLKPGARGRVFLAHWAMGAVGGFAQTVLEGEYYVHRFSVRYNDGKVKIVDCEEHSKEYRKLMNRVKYPALNY